MWGFLVEPYSRSVSLVGRVLVSRTDNVGSTVSLLGKASNKDSSRYLKGVGLLRQQIDGHGSRHSPRIV